MRFKATVPCSRAAVPAWTDDFGNAIGTARAAVTFDAAFAPPTAQAGSQIIYGVLRQTTITKPTLYVDRRAANLPALQLGAVISGDEITVNGEEGWEVDGAPGRFTNPFTGHAMPLVIELRRTVG